MEDLKKAAKAIKASKAHKNKRSVQSIYDSSSEPIKLKKSSVPKKPTKNDEVPLVSQSSDGKGTRVDAPKPNLFALRDSKSLSKLTNDPKQDALAEALKPTLSYQDGTPDNIDEDNADDPLHVTAYVKDIYEYYDKQEHRAVVGPYMDDHKSIDAKMRSILVDWLITVHRKMKLAPETLYLTVNIIDQYLARREVLRSQL